MSLEAIVTRVPLPLSVVAIFSGVWYLAEKIATLTTNIEHVGRAIERIETRIEKIEERQAVTWAPALPVKAH
jgi:hypothetical protein